MPRGVAGPEGATQRGLTLIEMAIVLVIIGIVLGMGFSAATRQVENEAISTTRARMEVIEEALIRYVTLNRRLPCPTDAALAEDDANFGNEVTETNGACNSTMGVNTMVGLPWRELGLPIAYASDGWRRRFRYMPFNIPPAEFRPGPGDWDTGSGTTNDFSLVRNDGLSMVACDPAAGTVPPPYVATDACSAGVHPQNYLYGRGNYVEDGNGVELHSPNMPWQGGGAAFVLISHGPDGAGAFLRTGAQVATPPPQQGLQLENVDDDETYTIATFDEGDTPATFFDDLVRAMSVFELADRTGLGPSS